MRSLGQYFIWILHFSENDNRITLLHLNLLNFQHHAPGLQIILSMFTCVCCKSMLVIYINSYFYLHEERRQLPVLELMQQAPECSSWFGSSWHAPPPPSSAFFLSSSSHNLREAADCTWRTLLRLSRSRQLLAGRRSANRCPPFLSHASRCKRTLGVASQPPPSSLLQGQEVTLHPPSSSRFSKHPLWLLISPL